MSDTGGGHRASGQALEAALEELHPGHIEVTMVDIFTEHSRWPYSQSVPAYQVRISCSCVIVFFCQSISIILGCSYQQNEKTGFSLASPVVIGQAFYMCTKVRKVRDVEQSLAFHPPAPLPPLF